MAGLYVPNRNIRLLDGTPNRHILQGSEMILDKAEGFPRAQKHEKFWSRVTFCIEMIASNRIISQ